MTLNILKLVDSDYQKDQLYQPIINELKDNYNIIKNMDESSSFKYKTNKFELIEFMIRDCNILDYTYYTFGLSGVIEASKKGYHIIYFIKCNDGIYYWRFNETEIMINYDWKGEGNICHRFSVQNNKFKLYK